MFEILDEYNFIQMNYDDVCKYNLLSFMEDLETFDDIKILEDTIKKTRVFNQYGAAFCFKNTNELNQFNLNIEDPLLNANIYADLLLKEGIKCELENIRDIITFAIDENEEFNFEEYKDEILTKMDFDELNISKNDQSYTYPNIDKEDREKQEMILMDINNVIKGFVDRNLDKLVGEFIDPPQLYNMLLKEYKEKGTLTNDSYVSKLFILNHMDTAIDAYEYSQMEGNLTQIPVINPFLEPEKFQLNMYVYKLTELLYNDCEYLQYHWDDYFKLTPEISAEIKEDLYRGMPEAVLDDLIDKAMKKVEKPIDYDQIDREYAECVKRGIFKDDLII